MAFSSPFDNDPFFRDARFPSMAFPSAFPDPFGRHALMAQQDPRGLRADPFQNMLMPFGGSGLMQSMLMDMGRMQSAMANGSSHCYSQSSVMHFSSGNPGQQPRIYQATSSTRSGPGGVKETRKAVRDSETAVQKMSVSHQIDERSHTIEKKCNARTRELEEHHTLTNLDQAEVPKFNCEWEDTTSRARHMLDTDHAHHQRARRRGLAPATPYSHPRHRRESPDPPFHHSKSRDTGLDPGAVHRSSVPDPVAGQRRPRPPGPSHNGRTSFPSQTHEAYYPSYSGNVDPLPRHKKNRVHIID